MRSAFAVADARQNPEVPGDPTLHARRAVALLGEAKPWVPPTSADLDVAIIGGGQSGVAIAFALRRAGIHRVGVFDAAASGEAGVWTTTARMETLRTEKKMRGLEQGIPELTFEFWFSSIHGAEAYAAIGRIPRTVWVEYLDWYRQVCDVAVEHGQTLAGVRPAGGDMLELAFSGERERRLTARKLVLATGVDGLGGPFTPPIVLQNVPAALRAHTAERIDFAGLAKRRIGVVGAAASAFDAAATALETGTAEVHLFARGLQPATQSPAALARNPILYPHFFDLPDETRWRLISDGRRHGHAPVETIARAERHRNFHLHVAAGLRDVRTDGGTIRIDFGRAPVEVDFLIAGTGYRTDLSLRPELQAAAPFVALWKDRYPPAAGSDEPWREYPYVDRGFAFQEKVAGTARWIRDIHVFNYGAVLSHGYHVGDIGSSHACIPRLVEAIERDLFSRDAASHLARSA